MLTEPFEPDSKKKWSQLVSQIKEIYRKVNECMGKPSSQFKFSNLLNPDGDLIGIRLYCLGPPSSGTESTLLFCDITNNDEGIQFDGTDGSLISSTAQTGPNEDDDNLKLPVFKWKELIHSGLVCKEDEAESKLSIEEKLQLERKRLPSASICTYEFHEASKRLVFSLEGSLYYVDDIGQAPYLPVKLPSKKASSKINTTICPSNPDLIAYVSGGDLCVLNIRSGVELQLTDHKRDAPGRTLSYGLPCYIVQEEFNRYVGFWWQPDSVSPNEHQILFEQVDETDVELIKLSTYDGSVEEYRYPKPGKTNASSLPKLASFRVDPATNEFHDVNVSLVNGIDDLRQIYSDSEYLVNCGWYNHDSIIVHLLNRSQQNLQLFLISVSGAFRPQVLYEETDKQWVGVNEVCEFLRDSQDQTPVEPGKVLEFIWASQESGYRHLYKIAVRLSHSDSPLNGDFPLKADLLSKLQLTSGTWEVSSEDVWLDSKNRLVYLIGLKDSPLEKQLYVVSLDQEHACIKKLTASGYSNSLVVFNARHSLFLNVQSSISKPPFGFLNVLHHSPGQLPSVHRAGYLLTNKISQPDGTLVSCAEQFEMLPGFSRPVLFSYQLKESGDIVYGLIYKPDFMAADKKYPCVLEVYGGPAVQLVTNTFRSVRLLGRHVLASQGYVVCVIDCRGSVNRGKAFEAHSHRRLGQVEINDQVEVLNWLASSTNYIDLNRVAIHGFSYGGYLSLLGYALRPDVFKCCLAGAPVTSWQLYDTGYTERYLDTPENNPDGYAKGSVLNHVSNFPNEENRLLIIHGLNDENVHFQHTAELIHELVKASKPYTLQIYPNERHSLRNGPTRVHFETSILSFLNQNL